MINMELDSCDTSQNQRGNILAIVPQELATKVNNKQTVVYDTNYPLFISLCNKDPIAVRSRKNKAILRRTVNRTSRSNWMRLSLLPSPRSDQKSQSQRIKK